MLRCGMPMPSKPNAWLVLGIFGPTGIVVAGTPVIGVGIVGFPTGSVDTGGAGDGVIGC